MANTIENKKNVRIDIQVLRGISIFAVLIYHIDHNILPLGYLGVDLFFVISGYVITRQINQAYKENNFSLVEFYNRRIWRLLPAALTVYTFSIVIGNFTSTASDFNESVKVLWGALLFSGNITLWLGTNYFTEGSKQLFLHTWSLGVEEQFYIFLPLIFIIFGKNSRLLFATISTIVLTSLLLYWLGFNNKPVATFYWLPTRAWELGTGVLMALLKVNQKTSSYNKYFWPISILVIVLSMVFSYTKTTPVNLITIIACTSLLLINPINSNSRLLLFFEKIGIKWLGDRSYSLYLVHWPLIVITNAYIERPLQSIEKIGVLASILIATIFLHKFIEKPFRRPRLSYGKSAIGYLILAAFLALFAGLLSTRRMELENNDPPHAVRIPALGECAAWKTSEPPTHCSLNGDGLRVLIWGDSYAHHLVAGLSNQKNMHITQATRGSCPALWNSTLKYQDDPSKGKAWSNECLKQNTTIAKSISEKRFDIIVISSSFIWVDNEKIKISDARNNTINASEALFQLENEILKSDSNLIVVSPPPVYDYDVGACTERRIHNLWSFDSKRDCTQPIINFSSHRSKINLLKNSFLNSEFIDLYTTFCNNISCKTQDDGFPLYLDNGHLRHAGSVLAANEITPHLIKYHQQPRTRMH